MGEMINQSEVRKMYVDAGITYEDIEKYYEFKVGKLSDMKSDKDDTQRLIDNILEWKNYE